MPAYYNESDPFAAAWLRGLIAAGEIPAGDVDERDIRVVSGSDLRGYDQCHFFAGIGGWARALGLAGWPEGRPVWTGSCPCQPFSTAGRGGGVEDERHLWPVFFGLIAECGPPVVFGEQVASKAGLAWLDLVSADLEGAGYAVGAADLCAAGVGAPHIRQRLWFVGMADGDSAGLEGRAVVPERSGERAAWEGGVAGRVGDSDRERRERLKIHLRERESREDLPKAAWDGERGGPFWSPSDWVFCRDPGGARWRPVEPGTFPLADGLPGRVGLLRGYGNAIVPQVAAELVMAVMDLGQ